MNGMKISVLTPDLSHNCLGRAVLLADLLDNSYEVEVIGPKQGQDIWEPMRNKYEYRAINSGPQIYQFLPDISQLLAHIDGEIVLASKPRLQSYGIGLLAKLKDDVPVVLDIDDWESGFALDRGRIFAYAWGIRKVVQTNSFYYKHAMEALSEFADSRTVSNRFLQKKFGGNIIPHARNTDIFDPDRFDKYAAREAYNLPQDAYLVMFSGTPYPYKGVSELVQAVASLDCDDARVVVVGAHESKFVDKLRNEGGDSLILRGQQPFDEIPRWLAAADVIAIPQKNTSSTQGQLPAKVFDAMSMGKPIIASRVADLPHVLQDCGILVSPGSVQELREAIVELYEDNERKKELGRRARQRCIEKYSYDAVAPRIENTIESL